MAPRLPGDVCETAGAAITATTALPAQSTLGLTDDYRDAGDGCGFHAMPGPDRAYEVTVPPGQRLTATAAPDAGYDLGVDLVLGPASRCSETPRRCLQGSDVNAAGQAESAQHLNATGAPQSVFVLVDSFKSGDAGAGTFDLTLTVAPPPPGDTCATAVALDAGGALTGQTLALFGNDYAGAGSGCAALSGGSDRVYQVAVPPGQRLVASVTPAGLNTSISIALDAAACAARTCAAEGNGPTGVDTALWSNRGNTPRDALIIVDAETLSPGGSFTVLATLDPAPPVPANDGCAGAEVLSTGVSAVYDSSTATAAGDPIPVCTPDTGAGVWFSFTPPVAGDYHFSTCASAPTATTVPDTVLALFTAPAGCAGPFTQVIGGCNDEQCGSQASFTVPLAAGTTYFLVAYKFGAAPALPGQSALQVRVTRVVPPANDRCAAAAPLEPDRPVEGTTLGAANDHQIDAGCFAGAGNVASNAPGREVVYAFTPDAGGPWSFRARGSGENLTLYLSTACGGGADVASCRAAVDRNASAGEELACVQLPPLAPVFAYVDARSQLSGSRFELEVNRCTAETEPNGTPATAGPLACPLTGGIVPAGDADFFALGAPPAGARVFALVDGVSGAITDFDLRVTTASETLELDTSANDVAFGSLSPSVAGTVLTGAASYLRVNVPVPNTAAEPYRLYAVVQPDAAQASAEVEPNSDRATASTSAANWFSGALAGPSPSSDVDVFAFDAAQGDLVLVGLDADPARDLTPFNPRLELLDAAGAVLIAADDLGATSSGPPDAGPSLTAAGPTAASESLVFRARSTGRHYVRVSTASTSTVSGAGDYLLSISKNCAAGP